MGVASSEFWDIPTSVITNYCTNAITIGWKKIQNCSHVRCHWRLLSSGP
jgi:hypothetical protein